MTRMTGADCLAHLIRGYGVTGVFMVPTVLTGTMAALEGSDVTRVMAHGEKAAAYMADGYSRMSGRPGVCMAQAVGASNLAAGLKDAWLSCTPVVAITGGPVQGNAHRRRYQEINDFAMYTPLTKANLRVEQLSTLPEIIAHAFRVATAGRPGPVHIELAGHYGQVIEDAEDDIEWPLDVIPARVPPHRPEPNAAEAAAVAHLLNAAERPIIVAGGGVCLSRAEYELLALAHTLSMPVATSLTAKGCVPEDHPLSAGVAGSYSRSCANQAIAEADLVFFIGTGAGSQVTNDWTLVKSDAVVVQMDIDPEQLGRHLPIAAGINCDARAGLKHLLTAVTTKPASSWNTRVSSLVDMWRKAQQPHRDSEATPMRPERICREVGLSLTDGGTVVCDTGHAAMWIGQTLEIHRPAQRVIRCEGSLGWGLPAAIGAKLASPEEFVLGFTGDGGFYYHVAELETAARHGVNVAIVVNDNGAMTQERPIFDAAYGSQDHQVGRKLWTFEPLDLRKVAESFGCLGIRAETTAELRDALDLARSGTDRPLVIDARSDPSVLAPTAWKPTSPS